MEVIYKNFGWLAIKYILYFYIIFSLTKSKAKKSDEISGMRREWEQKAKNFLQLVYSSKYFHKIFGWKQFDHIFYLLAESFAQYKMESLPKSLKTEMENV